MTIQYEIIEDILNNLDGVYMTIDPEWSISYVNPLSQNILGVSAKELIGTDLRETLPDVISMFYKRIHDALHNQKIYTVTSYYGPTQKNIELTVQPTKNGLLAVFRDVSGTKNNIKTIRDFDIRHKAILNVITDALIGIDIKGIITSFNNGAEKLFGYQSTDIIGENVSTLLPESERRSHEEYTLYSDLNEGKVIGKDRDLIAIRKDGSTFPIDIKVSPMNIDGHQGYLGIIRDITERKKAEKNILDAKCKVEVANKENKAKSEFLSCMSHELRTPLNAILGFAQILELDKDVLSERQNSAVQDILEGGHLLLHLINEVLDLAKIESGKFECDIKEVPLKSIINQCSNLINKLAEELNIQIDYGNPQEYIIMADPQRIKQVLINYLSNATKYNRPNGHVTITYQTVEENRLRINVTDTGEGIGESDLEMLFQPFTRVGEISSNIKGTGIGLAISKELMTLMNGTVGVSSTVGEGSTFWLEIKLGE